VGACWYGFDTPSSIRAAGVSGNPTVTAWNLVMERIHANLNKKELTRPNNVVEATICIKSGMLATETCDSATGYFVEGTQPKNRCDSSHASASPSPSPSVSPSPEPTPSTAPVSSTPDLRTPPPTSTDTSTGGDSTSSNAGTSTDTNTGSSGTVTEPEPAPEVVVPPVDTSTETSTETSTDTSSEAVSTEVTE